MTLITRVIPSSGELLPVVGLGSWIQFDVGKSEQERKPLREVLHRMHELGGRVIDSSPMYGNSEEVIGDLTSQTNVADQFFYATKVWTEGKQQGIDQMEDSFRKMKRETMDLMQIHNLVDWKTHLKTLREWKEDDKIRYLGITHYTSSAHSQLEKIIQSEPIDFVQFNYSIIDRNVERSLLATAMDKGVAVIINIPFGSGALFKAAKGKALPAWVAEYEIQNWAQYFLKYIIAHPAVTCVIPGTSDADHLLSNLQAAQGRLPDETTRLRMVKEFQSL